MHACGTPLGLAHRTCRRHSSILHDCTHGLPSVHSDALQEPESADKATTVEAQRLRFRAHSKTGMRLSRCASRCALPVLHTQHHHVQGRARPRMTTCGATLASWWMSRTASQDLPASWIATGEALFIQQVTSLPCCCLQCLPFALPCCCLDHVSSGSTLSLT